MKKAENVDQYMEPFPPEVRERLEQVRVAIKTIAPEAQETISYGMPAYKLKGKPLVYFAAYKNHVGFYATPNGHEAFKEELSGYKQGKGSVQFSLTEPLPLELIKKIVVFRVESVLNELS